MAIDAITQLLAPSATPVEKIASAGPVDEAAKNKFAALLRTNTELENPQNVLEAQGVVHEMTTNVEVISKVAGLFIQSINKLTSMQ